MPSEYEIMRSHTTVGGEIFAKSKFPVLRLAREIALAKERPLLKEWVAEGMFEVDTDAIPLETFAQVIGYAGARQGLLDYRPEKGGEYGLFTVMELEIA